MILNIGTLRTEQLWAIVLWGQPDDERRALEELVRRSTPRVDHRDPVDSLPEQPLNY